MRAHIVLLGVLLLPLAPAPEALDAGEVSDAPVRAERLEVGSPAGPFAVEYDASRGRLRVHALAPDRTLRPLDVPPVLVVATDAGPRDLKMTRTTDDGASWAVTDGTLKTTPLACRLHVHHEGSDVAVDLCPILRSHEGLLLLGGDTLRFVLRAPAGTSHLALEPFTAADVRAIGSVAPEVVVLEGDEERPLPVLRGTAVEPSWVIEDALALREGARAIVRVRLGDRVLASRLFLPSAPDEGLRGGTLVTIGTRRMRFELAHEPAEQRLSVFGLPGARGPEGEPVDSVELVVGGASPRLLKARAVRESADAWVLESPALGEAALEGRLRIRIGDQGYEVDLPGTLPPVVASTGPGPAAPPPLTSGNAGLRR
jgi:hypothetical protein